MNCAECELRPALAEDLYCLCLECRRKENEREPADTYGEEINHPQDEAHRMQEARRLK